MVFIHIFMQIFMSFYDGQIKQQVCHSFTLLISYGFKFILNGRLHQIFPVLMVKMLFPKFNRPLAPTSERLENPWNQLCKIE